MEKTVQKPLYSLYPYLWKGALAVLCLFLLLGSYAVGLDPYDCRILEDVSIGTTDVGGMTPMEAYRAVKKALQPIWAEDMVLMLPETTLHLAQKDTHVGLHYGQAVWAAYQWGRESAPPSGTGCTISLRPYLKADEEYLRRVLEEYAAQYDTNCTPSSHHLEGTMPNLQPENQPTGGQTLKLTMGLPTRRLDVEGSLERILTAYADEILALRELPSDILEEPEKPDLTAIYDQYYIAPVDDSLDMQTYQPIPGAYGYHFDLEKAQKIAAAASYGETVSIPMEFIPPQITGDAVYFRDILGYCQTPHTEDANRNHNLALACQAMNGVVLQPGEVFSYNDTLGQRTPERGYRRAGAYSGWELVQACGGGICQGSSTIYCAALYADLEIVQRRNHGYKVGYIEPGLDATVNWGGPDFQFRNSTHFPIQIAAEVSDGYVKVTILGTEERDYYIQMESEVTWGESAIYAKTYRCKYDRETDECISRELEARSNYER